MSTFKKRMATAGMGLATALMVAGCVQPPEGSKSQIVAMEVEKNFGSISLIDNRDVFADYDGDGLGFSIFRGYSELPFPDRYTGRAPEAYGNTLVVDFALDFKEVNGFPVYRIGVRPRKISLEAVRMLPGYVAVNTTPQEGRPSRLVAKLPASRALDRNGFIWTEYAYCSECFELRRISEAADKFDEGAFELFDKGIAASNMKSGQENGFSGIVRFVDYAQEGILSGAELGPITAIAHSEVLEARAKIDMVMPSRHAYFDFAKAYPNSGSAVNAMLATCGEYEPSGDPAVDVAAEKERVEGYTGCLAGALEEFDTVGRLQRIAELREQEAGLASAGAIEPENRIRISTIEQEEMAAYTLIRESYSKFMSWKLNKAPSKMTVISAPEPEPGPKPVPKVAPVAEPVVEVEPASALAPVPPVTEQAFPDAEERDDYPVDEAARPTEKKDVGEPICSIMILCPEKLGS